MVSQGFNKNYSQAPLVEAQPKQFVFALTIINSSYICVLLHKTVKRKNKVTLLQWEFGTHETKFKSVEKFIR